MEQQIWNIGDLELYWKHGPDDNSSEDLWRSVWETTEWSKVLSNLTYSLIGKILNLFAVTRPKKCIGRWHWLIRVPFTMMSVPIPKSVMHKLHFVLAKPKKGTERERERRPENGTLALDQVREKRGGFTLIMHQWIFTKPATPSYFPENKQKMLRFMLVLHWKESQDIAAFSCFFSCLSFFRLSFSFVVKILRRRVTNWRWDATPAI